MNIKNKKTGFTLVELLVVISIMSILTIISVASFRNAQVKAKDAQRKSDLNAVSKSLMMYFNDKGVFPATFVFGEETVGFIGDNNIIYMRKTPKDPTNKNSYIYVYKVDPTFKSFNLFANLENKNDSQCPQPAPYTVGGVGYCYGVASPNTVLKNW